MSSRTPGVSMRPDPLPASRRPVAGTVAGSASWGQALEESLVLIFPGAILVVLGLYFDLAGDHWGPARFPIWELLLVLGAIALAGGFASVFAEPEPSAGPVEVRASPAPAPPPGPVLSLDRRSTGARPREPIGGTRPSSGAPRSAAATVPRRPASNVRLAPRSTRFTSTDEALEEIDAVDALLRDSRRRLRRPSE